MNNKQITSLVHEKKNKNKTVVFCIFIIFYDLILFKWKKIIGILLILILIVFYLLLSAKPSKINETNIQENKSQETLAVSNIIEDVEYSSKDASGNEYTIKAKEGETDVSNTNIIFLKNVNAIIKLKNSNKILIFADFGKYNIDNFDTIFSKNVIINYLKKNYQWLYGFFNF